MCSLLDWECRAYLWNGIVVGRRLGIGASIFLWWVMSGHWCLISRVRTISYSFCCLCYNKYIRVYTILLHWGADTCSSCGTGLSFLRLAVMVSCDAPRHCTVSFSEVTNLTTPLRTVVLERHSTSISAWNWTSHCANLRCCCSFFFFDLLDICVLGSSFGAAFAKSAGSSSTLSISVAFVSGFLTNLINANRTRQLTSALLRLKQRG